MPPASRLKNKDLGDGIMGAQGVGHYHASYELPLDRDFGNEILMGTSSSHIRRCTTTVFESPTYFLVELCLLLLFFLLFSILVLY